MLSVDFVRIGSLVHRLVPDMLGNNVQRTGSQPMFKIILNSHRGEKTYNSTFKSGIPVNMPFKNISMYKNITLGKHMSDAVTSWPFLVCCVNKKWKNLVWSSTSLKFGSGCGSNWRLIVFKNSWAWLSSFFSFKLRSSSLLSAIDLKIASNKSPLIGNPRNPLAIASIWVPSTSKLSLILFADAWKK